MHLGAAETLLKPGMTAKAAKAVTHLKSAMQAPIGTVYKQNAKTIAFRKNDFLRPVEIEIWQRDDQFVVIKSDQIKKSDWLA